LCREEKENCHSFVNLEDNIKYTIALVDIFGTQNFQEKINGLFNCNCTKLPNVSPSSYSYNFIKSIIDATVYE